MISGVWVRDEYIAAPDVASLLECAQARRDRGDFAGARIGAEQNLQRRQELRGDSICWLTPPLFPAEKALLEKFETLRLQLNAESFLGLFELELHFAWYPPGAGYERHVDQPQGRDQRRLSLVLYLNDDWTPDAGGALRFYDETHGHCDVTPVGGRLVYFLTADREHAVLPALRDRWSVSGWFRTRD